MPHITLQNGEKVLVDERDFAHLNRHRWHLSTNGYAVRWERRDGKRTLVLMHREVLGGPEGLTVDHANRNTLDNRRANLRTATHAEQQRNRGGWQRADASRPSQFKGVSWDRGRRRWIARITAGGAQKKLGRFRSEHEAAQAYDRAARELHGRFAELNFAPAGCVQ